MRDFQVSRVYRWEDTLPLNLSGVSVTRRRCSLRRCKELIHAATKLYGIPDIEVSTPRNPRQTTAEYLEFYSGDHPGHGMIVLPKNFWRCDIALHEVSHYIVAAKFQKIEDVSHGPVFVRVYMHLLKNILGADIKVLEEWARRYSVQYSTSRNLAPRNPQSSFSRDI